MIEEALNATFVILSPALRKDSDKHGRLCCADTLLETAAELSEFSLFLFLPWSSAMLRAVDRGPIRNVMTDCVGVCVCACVMDCVVVMLISVKLRPGR